MNAFGLQDRCCPGYPIDELRPVERVLCIDDGRPRGVQPGRSGEHRCEGEHRLRSQLTVEQPKQQAQRDADDDRCHDRDVDSDIFPLNDDVAGQSSKSEFFRQKPCHADGNKDDSDEDQRLCHFALTATHLCLDRPP